MRQAVGGALGAGVIAFVIYAVIALLTGSSAGSAFGVGLLFLVGTALVTFVVRLVIRAVTNRAEPS